MQPTGAPVPTIGQVGQVPIVSQVGQSNQPQAQQTPAQQPVIKQEPVFRNVQQNSIVKGSLATFQYLRWKHDPRPLILCSSIYHDGKIAGINLHYLTFKYIRYLLKMYCGKSFSYQLIRGNNYIKNAFRTYKRLGVAGVKVIDCQFLLSVLGSIRSFNPNEIEKMRQEIQRQLRQKVNPTAEDMTNDYESVVPNSDVLPTARPTIADKRRNPDFLQPPE